jgi:hypothetical protein
MILQTGRETREEFFCHAALGSDARRQISARLRVGCSSPACRRCSAFCSIRKRLDQAGRPEHRGLRLRLPRLAAGRPGPAGGARRQAPEGRRGGLQGRPQRGPGRHRRLGQPAGQPVPGRAKYDGVFGMWYGKAPGVDRTGDVFKHANFAGVWPKGGVLAVAGDDHNCKSSTLPSQSEFAFQDFEMPVLAPADVQEVLDYGLLGYSPCRGSPACGTGMIALADTMDSGVTIDVGLDRHKFVTPENFPCPRAAWASAEGPADGQGAPPSHPEDPRRPGLRPRQRHRPGDAGRRPQGAARHRLPGPGLQGRARGLRRHGHQPEGGRSTWASPSTRSACPGRWSPLGSAPSPPASRP